MKILIKSENWLIFRNWVRMWEFLEKVNFKWEFLKVFSGYKNCEKKIFIVHFKLQFNHKIFLTNFSHQKIFIKILTFLLFWIEIYEILKWELWEPKLFHIRKFEFFCENELNFKWEQNKNYHNLNRKIYEPCQKIMRMWECFKVFFDVRNLSFLQKFIV